MIRRRSLLALLAAPAANAAPAGVVFPPGSFVGLVPPPGMVIAATFTGFYGDYEQGDYNPIQIVINDWPDSYFKKVSGMLGAELGLAYGISDPRRRNIQADGFPALLVTGIKADSLSVLNWLLIVGTPSMTVVIQVTAERTLPERSSDAVIEAALGSLVFRQAFPLEDALAALPFELANTADFRVTRFLGTNGVWLTEGPLDVDPDFVQPRLLMRWAGPSIVPPNLWLVARVEAPWFLTYIVLTEKGRHRACLGRRVVYVEAVGAGPVGLRYFSLVLYVLSAKYAIEVYGQTRVASRGDIEPRFRDAAFSATPKPRRERGR